ncbi:MAG: AzlC family ABC transporter permease [Defluviitaleaceae bacterium]|nr:AzlC family ABC transporter permease [Defluviitaleaceae bacterium]
MGIAYGILMSERGFGVGWIFLTSSVVFAGALQFVAISLLTSAFDPLYAFIIAISINARHLFYGISMLKKLGDAGKVKPYIIFAMCDETFSILCSAEPPPNVNKQAFMFFVAALNQSYWVIGGVIGGLIGPLLTFNTYGIDFVMTAFFVVVFINRWRADGNHSPAESAEKLSVRIRSFSKTGLKPPVFCERIAAHGIFQHSPALIGLGAATVALLIFGADNFVIPAMILIIVCLTLFRRRV